MLNIKIIAIGKIKDKWITDGIAEYEKRLKAYCKFTIAELKEYKLPLCPSQSDIDKGIENEGNDILKEIEKDNNNTVIAMCIEGKQLSSNELAQTIENYSFKSASITFVIGGSHGLSESVKNRADFKLSVSKMTFPHQVFRMILSEQIYRAFSIMNNGKYHK